ncbi:Stk1 family PASTA domain-containing Ser/Thr kinase [Nocardioides panacisoli]|uniref:Stk1 family PASTA domain-containing Ser/Thr kinase n=1 Tax=Nocardioides panacisoli TaxID=627624 RepID=UPI001C635FA3|nr:Stk1 family PASTA domain-containing Ser/Thr kinase [Nocardioides panacisoli]QYJ04684.1 Stk1 family PASTA domain-containing Ser/Thr kinase [Nocardioides panacisoli]
MDDPHTGRLLDGRYRVGGRIARGGMAGVYEAHDERLDRTVALKIMHAGLGDSTDGEEDFAARFVREARAAARLSHPHVVAVYDQGEDDGAVYLAMELVPGHTLRDVIAKEAPMRPERALSLLEPVLEALAVAHGAGLVHRDMKPENVLIADDGRVKVADFGLAKAVSADTQHTATSGVLLGTVSYLAPEVVSEGRADARADVYAVGVMLYELLTGAKPHTGDSPIQVAYAHVHHDVPPPSDAVPEVPDYVDALTARLTARDRGLRPSDAAVALHHVHRVGLALRAGDTSDAELVADLTPAARPTDTTPEPLAPLAREVAAVPPPPRTEQTSVIRPDEGPPRRQRRRRRPLLALLVMALVAGLLGGGYWFGWARYVSAPTVVGLTQAAAEEKLSGADLAVEYADPVHSETAPEGEVVSADPAAGGRILPEDAVTLTLSLGPERYDVPDVSGMTVESATGALREVKMVVAQTKERFSEQVAEGRVIRTQPKFGTERAQGLPVDTGITLVVSKGRKPIKVTDWTGQSAEKAQNRMTDQGLEVTVAEERFSESVAEGDVIGQSPKSGTLYKGDVVKLVVSKGQPFVTLPSVFNKSTDAVVSELESLGLEVKVERARIYFNGSRVFSIDPSAGSEVRKGSTVTITVV